MRIAIDAIGIERIGGGRSYVLNLIQGILEEDQANDYLIILSSHEPSLRKFPNAKQWLVPERNRFIARIKAQALVPGLLKREKVDIVHFAKNLGVFLVPCKSIVTIFDMTILNYPNFFPRTDVAYWRTVQEPFLKSVDKIVALSMSAKSDILKHYQLDSEKIRVIYGACDPIFRQLNRTIVEKTLNRYNITTPYILTVGNISPKKNFGTLIRAFAALKKGNELPHKLVLVGGEYWNGGARALRTLIDSFRLGDEIRFFKTIPAEDLVALYNGAALFALPSLDEGFGIVLVEAMACGTPVIANSLTATPEVVGDAGILLHNPLDEGELHAAMLRALTDSKFRGSLVERGLKRAAKFSWRMAGREYVKLYEQLAAND